MGEKRQKSGPSEQDGYTPVNGLAIAALITRAMPAAHRERIMARIAAQSPVVGAALEASLEKVEIQIQRRTTLVARQISTQLSLPETTQAPERVVAPRITKFIDTETEAESETDAEALSPAEKLLRSREGTHDDLERELDRQRPAQGRRKIISA